MLAYDYPILGLFWTFLIFAIWVAWLILLFHVFVDIFRSDMHGVSKGIWAIFVIAVPFLGVFIYLIAQGGSMAQRSADRARENEAAYASYVQSVAGSNSAAGELTQLADLHRSGALTDAEFEAQKATILAS